MVRPPLPFVLCVHIHSLRVRVCIYLCSIGTIRSGRFFPSFSRLKCFVCIYAKKLTLLLSQYSQYYSHNAEMIVALKKLCGIADIELTVR